LVEVDGAVVFEKHGYVGYGRGMTNHVAEYCGCIAVLEEIAKHEGDAIVLGDSAMVINQMKGQWNATKGDYLPYYEQAKAHLGVIGEGRVSFQFIPRAENARADALSNKAAE
jgi:probable phosphoglycerate mutase